MKKILELTRIQCLSFFGFNTFLHTKDKKERRKGIITAIAIIYALVVMLPSSIFYYNTLIKIYISVGAPQALLAVVMASASLLSVVGTIYKGSKTMFGFTDYEITMSLPTKISQIVISKTIVLYLSNIFFVLFLIAPAAAVYAYYIAPPAIFYINLIILTLLIPLIPIAAATIISVLISIISGKFRAKNIVNTIISLVFMAGVVYFSFSAGSLTDDKLVDIGISLMKMTDKIYPLASLFTDAVSGGNMLSFTLFSFFSLLSVALFVLLISAFFKPLHTYLTTDKAKKKFSLRSSVPISTIGTLIRKEARRYFASPIYVLNTIVSVVMLTLMSGVLLFGGGDLLETVIQVPGISDTLGNIAPLFIAALIGMTNTACISISMEGKAFPLLKSLPLKAMTIIKAKVYFNLAITIPAILINAPIISFALKLSPYSTALSIILPLLFTIFFSLFGIILNLKFPNFTWTNEVTVVKQSIAALFGVLTPMLLGIVLSVIIAQLSTNAANIALGVTCAVFALLCAILYSYLKRKSEDIFRRLI